ncbi:helix-turn-helix domain-containing protein [Microbispora amethystogenes]|uniref:helix-turn-helix domain-containing protein n=1 Tax=Microbispora amethystogenes TaxID=1427754 RepID=UPI0033C0606E
MVGNKNDNRLGSLIRSHRQQAGLSQQALADITTISIRAIRDLESGRVQHPHRETVRLLADGLRVAESQRAILEAAAIGLSRPREEEADALEAARCLPPSIGELVGRAAEMRLIRELIQTGEPMLAVVGLGGVGKSRLALEVAHELEADGDTVVGWYECRSVAQPLEAQMAALVGAARPRTALFVLDGCEAMHSHHGDMPALLRRWRNLRVLVTSRRPQEGARWCTLPLTPLRVPAVGTRQVNEVDAVRLLSRQLRRVRPEFQLNATNSGVIAEICRYADGIPAALELVAHWSLVHRLDDLRDELSSGPEALRAWHHTSSPQQELAHVIPQAISWLDASTSDLLADVAQLAGAWSIKDVSHRTDRPADAIARQVHTLLLLGLIRRMETSKRVTFEVLRNARYYFTGPVAGR